MIHSIYSYLSFLSNSTNAQGIHSPFVYNFVVNCLYKITSLNESKIKKYRDALLSNQDRIKVTDFGAGSRIFKSNDRSVAAIAKTAGIENILAEVLPEGKAKELRELQKAGRVVAMVGDGVNDAPALALADIGIAMGEGSDIAMESADLTLMRGDLREIYAAIQISRKTMSKIKQNLFWAFFYNSVGIPFAAMGFLNPIVAGAAMAFSSVSVVSNSLSLKKLKVI